MDCGCLEIGNPSQQGLKHGTQYANKVDVLTLEIGNPSQQGLKHPAGW